MSNLKPCPFCGSKNVEAQGIGSFAVVCKDCGANGPVVERGDMSVTESCRKAWGLWDNLCVIPNLSHPSCYKNIFISADHKSYVVVDDKKHYRHSWNDLPADRSEWDSDDLHLYAMLKKLGIKKGTEDAE